MPDEDARAAGGGADCAGARLQTWDGQHVDIWMNTCVAVTLRLKFAVFAADLGGHGLAQRMAVAQLPWVSRRGTRGKTMRTGRATCKSGR
jgi:hypothetical protein